MICKSCGDLYFRNNKQKICRKCYTNGSVKEKVFYTKKIWKKFSWGTQNKLSEKYDIVFKYEKPMKEKLKEKLKRVVKRNDPEKRKARRKKLSKVFKKIGKAMTDGSGNKKMGKLAGALGGVSHRELNFGEHKEPKLSRKKTERDDKFDGLLGSHPKYDALLSRKGEPKF